MRSYSCASAPRQQNRENSGETEALGSEARLRPRASRRRGILLSYECFATLQHAMNLAHGGVSDPYDDRAKRHDPMTITPPRPPG